MTTLRTYLLTFIYALINISLFLCDLCGKIIVINGALAHTLIMQNEPKYQTRDITVSDFLRKTSAFCPVPSASKKRTQNSPNKSPKRQRRERIGANPPQHPAATNTVRSPLNKKINPVYPVNPVKRKKRNKPNYQARKIAVTNFIKKTYAFFPEPSAFRTNPIEANSAPQPPEPRYFP